MIAALYGAQIHDAETLSIDLYAGRLREADVATIGGRGNDLLTRVETGRYGETQGPLRIGAVGAEQQLQHARHTGIVLSFPAYAASAFRRGMDAGLGYADVAALIEVLPDSA